jgi:hypothetical protein
MQKLAAEGKNAVEFLIDIRGCVRRRIANLKIAAVVEQGGSVHIQAIDRPVADQACIDRTVIVTLHPRLMSCAAVVTLGNQLAELEPQRIVVVATTSSTAKSWIFSNALSALRMVIALCEGRADAAPAAVFRPT